MLGCKKSVGDYAIKQRERCASVSLSLSPPLRTLKACPPACIARMGVKCEDVKVVTIIGKKHSMVMLGHQRHV